VSWIKAVSFLVLVNARIFSRSELRRRGIFRPSFVLGACCEPAWRDLNVPSDETLGRSHKKSLCTCGNFPHGIRIDETRSRSTGQLPRVCNERLLHLPNCELQPPGNTSLQRLNSPLPVRRMLQRRNVSPQLFFVPVTLEHFVPPLGSVIAAAPFR